jgi:hypothetical protein
MQEKISKFSAYPKGYKKYNLGEINWAHLTFAAKLEIGASA